MLKWWYIGASDPTREREGAAQGQGRVSRGVEVLKIGGKVVHAQLAVTRTTRQINVELPILESTQWQIPDAPQ